MIPTIEIIQSKFEKYNRLCFDGNLIMPEIGLNNRFCSEGITSYRSKKDDDGNVIRYDFRIELSVRLDLPEADIDNIIVHEMIHYHIGYNNLKDDSPHGHLFRSIMKDINSKYGLNVNVLFTPSDEALLRSVSKTRLVCVAHFKDGRTGIAVVMKAKAFQIWDAFEKCEEFEEVKWYISNCAIFDKYPITSKPSLYFVEADVAEHYLTGAVEMKRDGDVIHKM